MRKSILKTSDQMYYILDNPKSKQWIGYMSIKSDLEYVRSLINMLKRKISKSEKNEDDELIEKSIWISSIITYCKCFTNASKGRQVQLDKKNLFKNKPQLSSFHEEIMEMRNNYIAHAGQSSFEFLEPRIRLAPRPDGYFYAHLVFQGFTLTGFDENITSQFLKIIDFILEEIKIKIEKIGKLVLEDEEKNKSKEDMLLLMKKQFELDEK
jgi:hypothetical protein